MTIAEMISVLEEYKNSMSENTEVIIKYTHHAEFKTEITDPIFWKDGETLCIYVN